MTQVLASFKRGLERARLKARELGPEARAGARRRADGLVGASIAIRACGRRCRVAAVDSIGAADRRVGHRQGLTGGRRHALACTPPGPFVPVNCASVSALIEVRARAAAAPPPRRLLVFTRQGHAVPGQRGRAAAAGQALLRYWKAAASGQWAPRVEVPLNVRVVAAASRPLLAEVGGRFRRDLSLPAAGGGTHAATAARKGGHPRAGRPLRRDAGAAPGRAADRVTTDEMAFLRQYDWPGNVRELRNPDRALAHRRRAQRDRALPGAYAHAPVMRGEQARPTCTRWRSATSWRCWTRCRATRPAAQLLGIAPHAGAALRGMGRERVSAPDGGLRPVLRNSAYVAAGAGGPGRRVRRSALRADFASRCSLRVVRPNSSFSLSAFRQTPQVQIRSRALRAADRKSALRRRRIAPRGTASTASAGALSPPAVDWRRAFPPLSARSAKRTARALFPRELSAESAEANEAGSPSRSEHRCAAVAQRDAGEPS